MEFIAFVNDMLDSDEVIGGEQVRPFEFFRWLDREGIPVTLWCLRPRPRRRFSGRVFRLTPELPGPLRELAIIPAMAIVFVRAAFRTRRAGQQLVLWTRVPGGVSWKFGLPVIGDPSFLLFPLARALHVQVWATNHDISPEHEEDKIGQLAAIGAGDRATQRRARRSGTVQSWIQRFALKRATIVTAVSNGTRSELLRRYHLRPATTSIVRAGVDPTAYATVTPWTPPAGSWRVGYVGSAADSDSELLISTLRSLGAAGDTGVSIALMGRGFESFDLSLLPEGLHVEIRPDVRYQELALLAEDVDVWLVPLGTSGYHAWAWPLKIPMYLASGRPVVISRHPEVAAASISPYVFETDPTPSAGLAPGIRAVMADPEAARRRSASARQYALTALAWDNQFGQALALLTNARTERRTRSS